MPFQRGNKLRPPTAGRKSGTHNKITRDVAELLNSLNCNPLQGLAQIATNVEVEMPIRARCYAELAKYVHPQLKAIEHSGTIRTPDDGQLGTAADRILHKLAEATNSRTSEASPGSPDTPPAS